MAVYYASKAFVQSFTEAIASELEGTGVTATTLCPGPTESEFQEVAGMGQLEFFSGKLPTSAEVATFGYRAMEKGERTAVYGFVNNLLVFATRLQSDKALATMMKGFQQPNGSSN
jgi:short-subunit dehydrogenase